MAELEDDKVSEEERRQLNEKSIQVAMKAATLPVYISRFELVSAPLKDHVILTLGGGVIGGFALRGGEPTPFVDAQVHSAVMMSKEAALLMADKLKAHFEAKDGNGDTE